MVKGRLNNEMGQIAVRPEVIAAYAGSVAVECFGIVGMASVNMTDGLVRLLGRNKLGQGIQVLITPENKLRIAFHLIVAYEHFATKDATNIPSAFVEVGVGCHLKGF